MVSEVVSRLSGPSLLAGSRHGGRHGGLMPGSPYNISRNDPRLQKVVLTAAYYYNNQSNDAFLFKPSAIQRAQRQVWHQKRITPVGSKVEGGISLVHVSGVCPPGDVHVLV